MSIYDMEEFSRLLRLLENRCKVINQMLGFTVVGCSGNPLQIDRGKGTYAILMCGCELACFGNNDLIGANSAVDRLDAINDGFWYAFRGGILKVA